MLRSTAPGQNHPNEVFLSDDEKIQRMTTSNPWLENKTLGKQEIVSYESRDGKKVEGVMLFPTDYQAGQRVPLIVYVHGGPEASVANGWITSYSMPGQVARRSWLCRVLSELSRQHRSRC